jgi:hypothetical protein
MDAFVKMSEKDPKTALCRLSLSDFGSPILFVCKVYGSLRMYINYRGLNQVTRKDAHPLLRVDDTLDELKYANVYTHLDLAYGFRRVRVRDRDIHKNAFQRSDGVMEWVVMPFGLCNTYAKEPRPRRSASQQPQGLSRGEGTSGTSTFSTFMQKYIA